MSLHELGRKNTQQSLQLLTMSALGKQATLKPLSSGTGSLWIISGYNVFSRSLRVTNWSTENVSKKMLHWITNCALFITPGLGWVWMWTKIRTLRSLALKVSNAWLFLEKSVLFYTHKTFVSGSPFLLSYYVVILLFIKGNAHLISNNMQLKLYLMRDGLKSNLTSCVTSSSYSSFPDVPLKKQCVRVRGIY